MIQEGGAELPDCLNINNQKVPKNAKIIILTVKETKL